jgi:hypothetical protein
MPAIQIPNMIPAGQATQRGIAGYQNAMAHQSDLRTAGLQQNSLAMRNQEMQREQQNRAELEELLMSTPPEQRERAGLEFLKARDPEKAAKLQATYIKRFSEKARLDPKNAAMELENATGEKIELGNRYSKLPIEGGEAYIDNFTGHVFQPNNAAELAAVKNDFAIKLEKSKQEGREDLAKLKAELSTNTAGTARTTQVGNRIMQYNTKSGRYDIDVGPAPPKAPPASAIIYANEDIDSWVKAVETGQSKLTDVPFAVRGKVNSKIQKGGNLNVPPKIREAINGVDRAMELIGPAEDLMEKIIKGEDPVTNSVLLENYVGSISTLLSRSLGERGVATEGDVNRAKGLVPGWKSANFAPEFGRRELGLLKGLLQSQKSALSKNYFKPISQSGAETPTGGDTIRVKRKSDGKTGSMPKANFDPSKYDMVQ